MSKNREPMKKSKHGQFYKSNSGLGKKSRNKVLRAGRKQYRKSHKNNNEEKILDRVKKVATAKERTGLLTAGFYVAAGIAIGIDSGSELSLGQLLLTVGILWLPLAGTFFTIDFILSLFRKDENVGIDYPDAYVIDLAIDRLRAIEETK